MSEPKRSSRPAVKYRARPSEAAYFYMDSRFPDACILFSREHSRGEALPRDCAYQEGTQPITARRAREIGACIHAAPSGQGEDAGQVIDDFLAVFAERAKAPVTDRDRALPAGPFTDRSGRLAFQADYEELKPLAEEFAKLDKAAWARSYAGKPACQSIKDFRRMTGLALGIGQLCERMMWRTGAQDYATMGKKSYLAGRDKGAAGRRAQAARAAAPKAAEVRRFIREYLAAHPSWKKDRALKELSKQKADAGIRGWSKRRLQQVLKDFPASR